MITIKFFLAGTVLVLCSTVAVGTLLFFVKWVGHKNKMFQLERELRIEELRNEQLRAPVRRKDHA